MLDALRGSAPGMKVELDYHTPWELLVATILSAQCTDQRVNQVTPALFRRYRRPQDYATADPAELEALIRPTGFFKTKAKNLMQCAKAIVETFQGKVPDTMEALTELPGVGRKTANVLLGNAFGKPAVVVDTHVKRVAGRLHLTRHTDPEKIEMDLQRLLPAEQWTEGSQRLLLHGRYVCLARVPKCGICAIYTDCHWEGKLAR
jgi:endonuclease-3